MALAVILLVLIWCAVERRPDPSPISPPSPRSNAPRQGKRLDRWSLPTVRLLTVGAWSFAFAELASGRFPIGGLLAVGLFTFIGSVVAHEMRSYTSASELALVPIEDDAQRGAVSSASAGR